MVQSRLWQGQLPYTSDDSTGASSGAHHRGMSDGLPIAASQASSFASINDVESSDSIVLHKDLSAINAVPQRRLDADNEVRPKSDADFGPLPATSAQDTLIEHLTGYLFPENGSEANAPALFDCLQTVWAENEKHYSSIMKNDFNCNQQAIRAWIDERKASREIRRMIGGQPGSSAAERAKRLRAISRLRTLRRQAPAGRICKIFSLMTKTKEEGLFREGLDRLAEDDADILDPDDLTISMGGDGQLMQ